jgi:hypothetical protein
VNAGFSVKCTTGFAILGVGFEHMREAEREKERERKERKE